MTSGPASIDLSIVIVNYNTGQLILDCLQSIFQHQDDLLIEIIVVDNASSDSSLSAIQTSWPQVIIIQNRNNNYFSAGTNQGIMSAHGQYILVLNPDTLIRGNTLFQLINYMKAHPQVGAATTSMYFPDNTVQKNGSNNVTLKYLIYQYTLLGKLLKGTTKQLNDWLWYKDWDRSTSREVGVLPGSAIIAERFLWRQIGGFHESMLMYFSDDYFSTQVRKLNKETVFVPTDGITHYENASTRKVSRRALNIYFRDLLVYTGLVFGFPAQTLLAILLIPTWLVQFLRAT